MDSVAACLGRTLVWGLALALATGCAGPQTPKEPPPREAETRDLFPELSASLELQMEERRRAALARGAKIKALEIDPFEGQAAENRLEELGIPTLGGCALEPGRLQHNPALRADRRFEARDFRARDPNSSDPRVSKELLARRAVIPLVFVSCTLELRTQRSADGGFEVRALDVRFAAFFDTQRSWLNPRQRDDLATLQHARLHFDLADLLAREANQRTESPELVGRGATRAAARGDFALRWAGRLGRLQSELRRFESQLDRETAQGWDVSAHARWAQRIGQGLLAVRAALPAS